MKKYVQEATDINIWTSIKNNTFERNKDIKEFIDGFHKCVCFHLPDLNHRMPILPI